MSEATLEVRGLSAWYGAAQILFDLSFQVRRGEVVAFSPSRLAAVDSVYAMTVHKSQGSQFETAAVLLPPWRAHGADSLGDKSAHA